MRFLVLFITILLCSTTIKAQRLYSESGDFYEKSKRSVVDHAKLGVFYELKFRKDSTKLDDYTEAQTVLMVSDKHLLFSDYNRLALDSINDYLASSKQNKKDQKAREEWMQAIKKWTFFFVTLTDLEEQKTTVQTYDVLRSYEYTYIIRKTKCFRILERNAIISKTKRNFSRLYPTPQKFKKIDRLRRNEIHLKAVRTSS